MDDEKNTEFESFQEAGTPESSAAQRARNRTVMLTPDITGEVRARLAQDLQNPEPESPDLQDEPPAFSRGGHSPNNGGFVQPAEPEYDLVTSNPEPYSPPAYDTPPAAPQYIPPNPQGVRISAPPASTPVSQPVVASETGDRIVWAKKGKVVGFLTSFDRDENGEYFALRSGRLIVTSEAAANGNFLIIGDSSVSPMHAILRISQSGEVQVLDQLSEYGTKIKHLDVDEMEELSGDKGTLEHGDVIYFGERKFHVSILILDEEG